MNFFFYPPRGQVKSDRGFECVYIIQLGRRLYVCVCATSRNMRRLLLHLSGTFFFLLLFLLQGVQQYIIYAYIYVRPEGIPFLIDTIYTYTLFLLTIMHTVIDVFTNISQ